MLLCTIVKSQRIGEEDANLISTEDDRQKDDDGDSDNDYDLQQLEHFQRHPININSDDVEQLIILDRVLINNLFRYRKLLGDLIDLHELQAVPGFSVDIIKKILPYITVDRYALTKDNLHDRLNNGDCSVMVRLSIVPEKSKGFTSNDSSSTHFSGGRTAMMSRYKYQYRNLLQYGFLFEKDAGEKMFTKNHLPQFISVHFFMRQAGIIKALAVGDFTVNMGQGLIHWQSQAFGKNGAVINIKRQSDVLRPYSSAGEYNFNRGAAATLQLAKMEITLFASTRKLSANIRDGAITSISTSGLNRTVAELNDRNTANILLTGSTIRKNLKSASFAVNYIRSQYSLPVFKRDEPYNIYAIKGAAWSNYSIDYNYTYRNFHFFGEAATDAGFHHAITTGVMASLGRIIDLSLLYRNILKNYQSVYGNAFTENSAPTNEEGFYTGLSLKPHQKWQVDMYADVFRFPWLKYRLNAPSTGSAYFVQVTFRPSRQIEMYTRVRTRNKPLNIEKDDFGFPVINLITNWRTHLNIKVSRTIIIRSRLELCSFANSSLPFPATGYLFYTEMFYRPANSRFSGNARFQAFEGTSYDARIYAYESDVLFVSSTPAYYNYGVRYYANLRARFCVNRLTGSDLVVNVKVATTVYTDISTIGTGPSAISGNRNSTLKMQFFLSF
jgi:hypothetical protein